MYLAIWMGPEAEGILGLGSDSAVPRTSGHRCIRKSCCLRSCEAVTPSREAVPASSPLSFLDIELLGTILLRLLRKGYVATGLDHGFVLLPLGLFCFQEKISYAFTFSLESCTVGRKDDQLCRKDMPMS